MTGLEFSRSYCEFYAPTLFEGLPSDVRYRAALGLVGEGSECLGFDDEISRDHDFGPGFCVWLPTDVYEEWGPELQRRYDLLPVSFKGFTRQQTQMAGKRVGVFEMQAFYRLYTGLSRAPQCAKEWLAIPEQLLAQVTSGEVFADPSGEFSALRVVYQGFYPDEVMRKKFAAYCASMAQAGQYNLPRCLKRKDAVAASAARSEFLTSTMAAFHLLAHTYMPYYKWAYRSLAERACAPAPVLDAVRSIAAAPVEQVDQDDVEVLCQTVGTSARLTGWTSCGSDFLLDVALDIQGSLRDLYLAACPLAAGGYR